MKPNDDRQFRVSYNRAFRSPSMINNNLQVTIAKPVPLTGSLAPFAPFLAARRLPAADRRRSATRISRRSTSTRSRWATPADLERRDDRLRGGVYVNKPNNEILFTQQSVWRTVAAAARLAGRARAGLGRCA